MTSGYVLVTAAKNEETYIREAIQLTLQQKTLPIAWVIVDDGSQDRTAEIVKQYAAEHPFIHLQSSVSRRGRNFGSQYKAVQAGYELVRELDFEFLGVQDADLGPAQEEYYEVLMDEFTRNPQLGMASGFIYERSNGEWKSRAGNSIDSTTGSAMFRRQCFEQIGGYTPLAYGGSDTLAQIDARMHGWEILVRPDLHIFHYRATSSAGGVLRGRFRQGLMDASLGYHPIFEFLKCCRRVLHRPILFGSVVRLCGYTWWIVTKGEPLIPSEKVTFVREEQKVKLLRHLRLVSRGPD